MNRERKKLKKFARKIFDYKPPFVEKRPYIVGSGYEVYDETGCGGGCYETLEEAREWLKYYKSKDAENGDKRRYCIVRETFVKEIVEVVED